MSVISIPDAAGESAKTGEDDVRYKKWAVNILSPCPRLCATVITSALLYVLVIVATFLKEESEPYLTLHIFYILVLSGGFFMRY